jgi:hypothetical protein
MVVINSGSIEFVKNSLCINIYESAFRSAKTRSLSWSWREHRLQQWGNALPVIDNVCSFDLLSVKRLITKSTFVLLEPPFQLHLRFVCALCMQKIHLQRMRRSDSNCKSDVWSKHVHFSCIKICNNSLQPNTESYVRETLVKFSIGGVIFCPERP